MFNLVFQGMRSNLHEMEMDKKRVVSQLQEKIKVFIFNSVCLVFFYSDSLYEIKLSENNKTYFLNYCTSVQPPGRGTEAP